MIIGCLFPDTLMVCFIPFSAKIVNVLGFNFIKDIGLGDFSVFQHVGPVMFYQM